MVHHGLSNGIILEFVWLLFLGVCLVIVSWSLFGNCFLEFVWLLFLGVCLVIVSWSLFGYCFVEFVWLLFLGVCLVIVSVLNCYMQTLFPLNIFSQFFNNNVIL